LALTAARLPTRVGPDGVAQLLEDQPREQWDHGLIALGLAHLDRSARGDELTVWHLRAEIALLHSTARTTDETDWPRIASIYAELQGVDPSPMVALARAVAIGRAEGPAAGLAALPDLPGNPYGEAARGVFLGELGRVAEARRHFEQACSLARTDPERRLMEKRLRF
jgi:RNA polymerase sigma-70 factor (ECF subfamily)